MIKDIIDKKRLGKELTKEELEEIFNGYLEGTVKDYQMSSLLMAICIEGMSYEEILNLTDIFLKSGEQLNYEKEFGTMCDKHSTGGIGDKTTLVVVPIVASLGVPVVKMSGRGLGYTGGTIDKLESIPGYRTDLTDKEIEEGVRKVGAVITGQTKDIAPLDKMVYALRDVTATVSSIPLIAVSIMSKKLALGASKILLDVKYGKGALVGTKEEAEELATLMQNIGKSYGREVRYVLSDMNNPLGRAIGNSVEVMEAVEVLNGEEEGAFKDLCIKLAGNMISMVKDIPLKEAESLALESIDNKKALNKFLEIVKNQNGNINGVTASSITCKYKSKKKGTIKSIDALKMGKLSLSLGAGRKEKDDKIDHNVGIILNKLVGEKVDVGDTLMTLYINSDNYEVDDTMFEIV